MKLEVYNNVNLKEYPIHAEEEVRVSERQVGFDGFCHQMNLLKFLGTVHRKNVTVKRRKKEGRMQLKVNFVTMYMCNTQISSWQPCCFPKDIVTLIVALVFSEDIKDSIFSSECYNCTFAYCWSMWAREISYWQE